MAFYVKYGRSHRPHCHRRRRAMAGRNADVRWSRACGGHRWNSFRRRSLARGPRMAGVVTPSGRSLKKDEAHEKNHDAPAWRSRSSSGGEPDSAAARGNHCRRRDAGRNRRQSPPERRRQPAGTNRPRRRPLRQRPKPAAGSTAAPIDGGWPRVYDLAERRQHARLSAADLELGDAETSGRVQRGVASRDGRATSRRSARSSWKPTRPSSLADRLVKLPEPEDRRSELSRRCKGTGARDHRADRQGHSRRRARHRARSRAGQSRQEPDRPEERRGRQGRSADRSSSARRPR